MSCWYYGLKDLQNTPSFHDGIQNETENRYRNKGARFIIKTGWKMDLHSNTIATAIVYFHRFYVFHSFRTFPMYRTACCCLFLACKVEKTPRNCKDIIKVAKSLLTEQKFSTFGEDPKEKVMTLERIFLQTVKFDLQVVHPYRYLLKYAKCFKGDKAKLHKILHMAWTFVNDSLCTTLCLQWEPEKIAVAFMFLALKINKFEVVDWNGRTPQHTTWWDMFVGDITTELLEDICHQLLDIYLPGSPPFATEWPTHQKPPVPQKLPKNDVKNGSEIKLEPPELDMRFTHPADPAVPAYPVYGAPPPNLPPPSRLAMPTVQPGLGYPEPPPGLYAVVGGWVWLNAV